MKHFLRPALLVAMSLALAACILNPQPFPPQSTDNGGNAPDASAACDASRGDDGAPPMSSDGGSDAAEPRPDAAIGTDASLDGGTDAALDASPDATDDAESDATGD